ncbi:MAG: nitroreductase family deazaflavin-dependent oxidoreductase [Solirubrobacteraceae bacterium]
MAATRFLNSAGKIVAGGGAGAAVMSRLFQAHVTVYRLTGGLIGHRFPGMPPFLLLEHVGAKSGKVRTTPLGYVRDGENLILIGSNGGGPRNPGWFYNLQARPYVRVWIGSQQARVLAHVADPAERDQLWPTVLEVSDVFTDYQRRTERQIPLVVLEPTT